MRLVVTGALGYVGSRLIRDAAAAFPGCEIVMIDNLAAQRYATLFDLPEDARYQFVEDDVLTANLHRLFEDADAVIHLAALTGQATDDPSLTERVHVEGTERVAMACARARVPLLFPSTTSLYGASGTVFEATAGDAIAPQTPYAQAKLRAERHLKAIGHHDHLRYAIFRMGTIFGPSPGIRFHTAVNRFCWQAVTGQPLGVWRTALDQQRPYLDLGDAVRAMLFVTRERLFDGRLYHVATETATVRQVVAVLQQHVPDLRLSQVDSPLMNQLSYAVDDARLRGRGVVPEGSLSSGIGATLALLRAARSGRIMLAGVTW